MDILWITIGIILLIVGIIGCILPIIPGQAISYFSLLMLQLTKKAPFNENFLVIMALIMVGVTIMDYVVPIYGTKKFGGTKKGLWGSAIGLIFGIIILPFMGIVIGPFGILGIILGPFAGAYIGESMAGRDSKTALRAAFGSFIGFLAGTMMKLAYSIIVAYYFFSNI
ncbi:MAG: DUF456 domain-containing protein [Bacteroidetes bacterium]|nr:DUF456 domain-containing protein [Bacteroidota bacterium]